MKLEYNENINIEVFTKLDDLTKDLLKYIKPGNIALSGGSTYMEILKSWAKMDLDLTGVEFFPVDERVVEFNNMSSNWGNAYRIFLAKFLIDPINHYIDADLYEERLKDTLMDTIFLGVGDDGHTASLFDSSYVFGNNRKAISSISPKEPKNRISLTGDYIISGKNIVIVFYGEGKKDIVTKLLNNEDLPITTLLRRVNNGTIYIESSLLGDGNE